MNSFRQFFTEEDGAITIVEILVILAIIVVVALLFKSQLITWVQSMLEKIFGNAEKASEIPTPTP